MCDAAPVPIAIVECLANLVVAGEASLLFFFLFFFSLTDD